MAIHSVNPATGEVLQYFEPLTREAVENKLARSQQAFLSWRHVPLKERARLMSRAAEILETEKDRWAALMTREMGKPIRAAGDEAKKCAWVCRYYAENAPNFLAEQPVVSAADRSSIRFDPLGVILAIMPWNFPFWQVFRFAAPTLMAGNVAVLKHASNVPQCALAIEEIFKRAGFPEDVFQSLLIGAKQAGAVLEDPRVMAVSLTGSDSAGRQVGETAGRALKKAVLELGGSDPFIVMPSANIAEAAATGVTARVINNGQSCIAAKRFIVHQDVFPEFEKRFLEKLRALKVGDPADETVDIGPLATREVLENVTAQVDESVRAGARLLTGGHRLPGVGNYYAPTALTDIPGGSPAFSEEIFGPVALLFQVKSLEEALAVANSSRFGLGAALWSTDPQEQRTFIERIESGSAFINGMVASDPRLPFGGVKHSGHGRELSQYGIREFVNIKTVWIREARAASAGRVE